MNVPTTPVTPSVPQYSMGLTSPSTAQLASAVGTSVGNTALAGYQTYELVTAKGVSAPSYTMGAIDIASSIFAAVPIVGPVLQAYSVLQGVAKGLNDYLHAKRKIHRIKKQQRYAETGFNVELSKGSPPELAAFLTMNSFVQSKKYPWEKVFGVGPIVEASPFSLSHAPPGTPPLDPLRYVVDPTSGQVVTVEQMRRKASGQYAREAEQELASRLAPGRGLVPAPFARYYG